MASIGRPYLAVHRFGVHKLVVGLWMFVDRGEQRVTG